MKKYIKILVVVVLIFQINSCSSEKKSFMGTYYSFGSCYKDEIILISEKEKNWKKIITNNYKNQDEPKKGIAKTNYYTVLHFNSDSYIQKEFNILTDSLISGENICKWKLENNILTLVDNKIGVLKVKYKIIKKNANKTYLRKIHESAVIEGSSIKIDVKRR